MHVHRYVIITLTDFDKPQQHINVSIIDVTAVPHQTNQRAGMPAFVFRVTFMYHLKSDVNLCNVDRYYIFVFILVFSRVTITTHDAVLPKKLLQMSLWKTTS